MTLSEFKGWLTAIDPSATRYFQPKSGCCTIWKEHEPRPLRADGKKAAVVWKIQIERYTTVEDDPIAAAIELAIENSDCIAASHQMDSDPDEGMIRHIFDCEVLE